MTDIETDWQESHNTTVIDEALWQLGGLPSWRDNAQI